MSVRSLVVDDEPDIRDFIGHVLRRAGHHVTLAGDGATVLEHAAEQAFDLVVLDHHMPSNRRELMAAVALLLEPPVPA